MKKSFIIYDSWALMISQMPNEEAGQLIKKICKYEISGEYENGFTSVDAIFSMIKAKIDEDSEKYEEICKKRRESGSLGGKQKKANGKQMLPNGKQMQSDTDTDTDTVSDTDTKTDSKSIYAKKILDLYHEHCPSLPKVLKLTDKRIKLVNARIKEYSEEQIIEVFDKAEKSDFLKNGSGTWKGADFEWILNPNNFIKIMEGNYQNKTKTATDIYRSYQHSNYDFETLERETKTPKRQFYDFEAIDKEIRAK